MPKYHFTTAIDRDVEHTDNPLDYATEKAATDAAQESLLEMARDTIPDGKHAEFTASVTDESGDEIYLARLSLNTKNREDIVADENEAEAAFQNLRRALAPNK